MATVEERGPHQYRVKVRRQGISQTQTFETRSEAESWARIIEGKVTGEEFVDRRQVRSTTLAKACAWMLDWNIGTHPDARNIKAKLHYWQISKFADWSLAALHEWDLKEWRQ